MLMLAIFSGTMQLSKDQVACLPILEESTNPQAAQNGLECSTSVLSTAPSTTRDLPDSVAHELLNTQPTPLKEEDRGSPPQPRGRKTNLDYSAVCFCQPNMLPWCPTMVQQILPLPCPHTHHNANGKQQFLVQVPKDQLKDWTLCFHFGAVLWITMDNESFVWNCLWRFWGKAEIHRRWVFPETCILGGQAVSLHHWWKLQQCSFQLKSLLQKLLAWPPWTKKMENKPRLFLRKCENFEPM